MTPLFTAIYTRLAACALLSARLSGRMYPSEAPQGSAFPYVVYELIPGTTDYVMCPVRGSGMNFDECQIQFNLYSNVLISPAEVGLMFAELTACYDWHRLVIPAPGAPHETYTTHYMRRDRQHLTRDIDNNVWQYVVTYTVLLES